MVVIDLEALDQFFVRIDQAHSQERNIFAKFIQLGSHLIEELEMSVKSESFFQDKSAKTWCRSSNEK